MKGFFVILQGLLGALIHSVPRRAHTHEQSPTAPEKSCWTLLVLELVPVFDGL